MLQNVLRDRGVLASAASATVLAAGSTVIETPWWVWTAWAAITVAAVVQAMRYRHDPQG